MEIITTSAAMNAWCATRKREGKTIGLVPTMGYLHEGHLSLIHRAAEASDCAVVSIFVNPTQFAPNEDYACYPRKEAEDCELCRQAGASAVFMPHPEEMYITGASTWVEETVLCKDFCGASRPIHFRGVCTVVAKLFHIVMPDCAIFGQKDFQQVAILKRMIRDLSFPIRLICAPIVREADGLAKSSRNTYLTPQAHQEALSLSRSLFAAKAAVDQGETDSATLEATIRAEITASNWQVEYVSVINADTLARIPTVCEPAVILVAARQGNIRLIDNIILCE